MTDIGRAGIVMKGNYNSASTYETLDAVTYQNGLYVAKQNVPAGIAPTNTTYWQSAIDAAGIVNNNIGFVKRGFLTANDLNVKIRANDGYFFEIKNNSGSEHFFRIKPTESYGDVLGFIIGRGYIFSFSGRGTSTAIITSIEKKDVIGELSSNMTLNNDTIKYTIGAWDTVLIFGLCNSTNEFWLE